MLGPSRRPRSCRLPITSQLQVDVTAAHVRADRDRKRHSAGRIMSRARNPAAGTHARLKKAESVWRWTKK